MIIVGSILVTLNGGPSIKYMIAPGTLLLVLGMTVGLGFLTYDRNRFFGAFKKIFSRQQSGLDKQNKRMLSQLALYALVSGIVLAVMQILLQSFRTQEGFARIGSNPIALRAPLTTLLYAALTATGLWLFAFHRESIYNADENDVITSQRQNMLGAGLLLIMTMGLVLLLLAGMTKDSFQSEAAMAFSDGKRVDVVHNKVEGLYQDEDLFWRPSSMRETKETLFTGNRITKRSNPNLRKHLIVSDAVTGADEMPLRWELSLAGETPEKDLLIPEQSQLAFPQID